MCDAVEMFTGMSRTELVNTGPHLSEVVDRISRAPRVAVDIESNGFFRYHERVCLVQLAAYETAFLVDPLAIDDIQPLGDLLGDQSVEKVFHGADYDLRSLDRDWGFRVNNLFDTGIAAAFVGSTRLGLQSVVQEYLGIELAKPIELQRSDWTLRPNRGTTVSTGSSRRRSRRSRGSGGRVRALSSIIPRRLP